MKNAKTKGFTLLEILLVVAAIAILAGIVILAINPTKQLGDTKNAARRADVNTVLNAVYQYSIDNNGALLPELNDLTENATSTICKTGETPDTTNCDVSLDGLTPTYITAVPVDPDISDTETSSGYDIMVLDTGRITVSAPKAYGDANISVTK
jgi:prepilin-type N-terminal cleavage/methylation domain-containing protein